MQIKPLTEIRVLEKARCWHMAFTVFKIPVGYRLYDREKNKIISITYPEYLALKRILQGKQSEGDQIFLQHFQEKGFCQSSDLKEIEHPATQKIRSVLEKGLNQVILQVTQNCNLRCSYCAYSGSYFNRTHSKKRMSGQIAFRAVDFFMSHSSEASDATIGFYGGEPLLEFSLIKEIVAYVEREYPERNIQFNLTTNLTLLTPEILDYLIEKNIAIMISIDGPKNIQDRNRVFVDGKGSFDTVMANARRIKQKDPDYFSQCMTNTVISPGCNYDEIFDFLDHSAEFRELTSFFSRINDVDIKKHVEYDEGYDQMIKREILKLYLAMLGKIEFSQASRLMRINVASIFETNQMLGLQGTKGLEKTHPGGPCVPGTKRLFVDVDGNFYPCERIAEYPGFQIGNLDEGYFIERIVRMMNIGQMTREQCIKCWAFLYCGTCAANMTDQGNLSREIRLSKCSIMRSSIIDKLANLEMMRYYNLDFMQGEE